MSGEGDGERERKREREKREAPILYIFPRAKKDPFLLSFLLQHGWLFLTLSSSSALLFSSSLAGKGRPSKNMMERAPHMRARLKCSFTVLRRRRRRLTRVSLVRASSGKATAPLSSAASSGKRRSRSQRPTTLKAKALSALSFLLLPHSHTMLPWPLPPPPPPSTARRRSLRPRSVGSGLFLFTGERKVGHLRSDDLVRADQRGRFLCLAVGHGGQK